MHGEARPLVDGLTDEGETTCQLPLLYSASLPRDLLLNVTVVTWNREQDAGLPSTGVSISPVPVPWVQWTNVTLSIAE